MVQEKSVGAIIFRKEADGDFKYLLLHYKYKSDYWDIPRGRIEKDESEEQTALREIKEETGLYDIHFVPKFHEKVSWFYRRDGEAIFKEVIILLAETMSRDIVLSTEHIGYVWLNYEKACEKITFGNAKGVLEKAHQTILSIQAKE